MPRGRRVRGAPGNRHGFIEPRNGSTALEPSPCELRDTTHANQPATAHDTPALPTADPPRGRTTCPAAPARCRQRIARRKPAFRPSSMYRRRCSMKWNMFVGALVVSMGLCSQSFGFDLLNRMLGRGHGGCCQSQCCETSCCEPTCCQQEAACCQPEPACCEPACGDPCGNNGCGGHQCALFGKLKGLFGGCHKNSCCEQACGEPACCEPEPACCEPACGGGCDNCCKRKRCGFLKNLFKRKHCGHGCGNSCCGGGCGAGGCGTGGAPMDGGPAPAAGETAPMPPAPMADPSASIQGRRNLVHASRNLVRRD